MHRTTVFLLLSLAVLPAGCDAPGGEGGDGAEAFPPDDAPDHEVVQALVTFREPVDDSVATAFAVRHSLEPWGVELELPGMSSSRSGDPEKAGIGYLDQVTEEMKSDLQIALCALPDRAAQILEEAGAGAVDPTRARGVIERVERLERALTALREGERVLVRGMRVSATVAHVREAAADPRVGSVERAFTPDDEAGLAAPPGEREPPTGAGARPETTEARTGQDVDPARVRARLESVARGYEGCGVSGPRS